MGSEDDPIGRDEDERETVAESRGSAACRYPKGVGDELNDAVRSVDQRSSDGGIRNPRVKRLQERDALGLAAGPEPLEGLRQET